MENKLSDRIYYPNLALKSSRVLMESGYYKPITRIQSGEKLYGGNTVISNDLYKDNLIEVETNLGYIRVPIDHQFVMKDGTIKKVTDLQKLDVISPPSSPLEARRTNLTDTELICLGCWLANGILKKDYSIGFICRKKGVFNLIKSTGIKTKNDFTYGKGLSLNQTQHPNLAKLILSMDQGVPFLEFGYEEYALIYKGYLLIGGHLEKTNKIFLYGKSKDLGLFIQFCSILDGNTFRMANPETRIIGYFGEKLHKVHMTRSRNVRNFQIATVISVKEIGEGLISHLKVDGDHTYFSDNLQCYGR